MLGDPAFHRPACETIARVCADRAPKLGLDFDATVLRCLAGWKSDPWVIANQPMLSHCAANPAKYLDAPPSAAASNPQTAQKLDAIKRIESEIAVNKRLISQLKKTDPDSGEAWKLDVENGELQTRLDRLKAQVA